MPYDPASASKKVEVAGPPPPPSPPKVPTAVAIIVGSLASGAILTVLSLRHA